MRAISVDDDPAAPRDLGHYDVVVVGGGPAGLSGALLLGRALRTVLVVDDERPRNEPATHVHAYLSRDGAARRDFLAESRAEIGRYSVEVRTDRVTGVASGIRGDFALSMASGVGVTARRLLVTSGLVDELPEVPGIAERWGRDVLYCPYCHGWEVRDAPLGVLATDPIDVRKAQLLRQWSADVALFLHTMDVDEVPDEQWDRLAAVDIEVITGSVESLIVEDDRLTGLRLSTGHRFALTALFVSARPVHRDHLLTSLGAATEAGPAGPRVVTDDEGRTSVRGVWAAGNVVSNGDQIVNAAAAGSAAAQAINADLVHEDIDNALSRHHNRTPPPTPTPRSGCRTRLSGVRRGVIPTWRVGGWVVWGVRASEAGVAQTSEGSTMTPTELGAAGGARMNWGWYPRAARIPGELLYALVGAPLALLGIGYVVVSLALGVGLAVTFVGLPLLAASAVGARGLGAVQRALAAALLGVRVDGPSPPHREPGLLGWIGAGLRDRAAWRARAYQLLRLPVAVVACGLAVGLYGYGLAGISYPLWRRGLAVQFDSAGRPHQGAVLGTDRFLDTWPQLLLVALAALLLLLIAPMVVHGVLALDLLLVRALLGPSGAQELRRRVQRLERSRAHAVDDSAATLRRIERDLHDGPQARLVTTAMTLGMVKDRIESDSELRGGLPAEVTAAIDSAHRGAKEALGELRDVARGFHPPILDNGLEAALSTLVARSAVPVRLHVDLPERPVAAVETIAYFCAAELLTNVAKHSGATSATVDVDTTAGQDGPRLRLRVGDNGCGGARIGDGAGGLAGLATRLDDVDGRLGLSSPPGGPTTATVELPSRTP